MAGDAQLGPPWRVRRIGGVLVPGFTKRFAADAGSGTTYLWGLPIGRFRVEQVHGDGGVQLRYLRWPIVDLLEQQPGAAGSILAAGFVAIGDRRLRFCRFRLER